LGALSLELNFKILANNGCEISDNHSIPEADANNPRSWRLCSSLFLVQWLPLGSDAQKQRYFQSGMDYFQKGRYRKAIVQFQNAVQMDKRFR